MKNILDSGSPGGSRGSATRGDSTAYGGPCRPMLPPLGLVEAMLRGWVVGGRYAAPGARRLHRSVRAGVVPCFLCENRSQDLVSKKVRSTFDTQRFVRKSSLHVYNRGKSTKTVEAAAAI